MSCPNRRCLLRLISDRKSSQWWHLVIDDPEMSEKFVSSTTTPSIVSNCNVGAWKLTVVVWSYTLLTFMMRAWCMIFFYVMHPSPTIIFWWKNLELIQSQTLTYKWQDLFKHKKVLYLNNFIKAISQNIKIVLKIMLWEGSKLRIDQWNAFCDKLYDFLTKLVVNERSTICIISRNRWPQLTY